MLEPLFDLSIRETQTDLFLYHIYEAIRLYNDEDFSLKSEAFIERSQRNF